MNIENKPHEITSINTDDLVDKTEASDKGVEHGSESISTVDVGTVALKGAEVAIEPEKIIKADRNRLGYSLIGCCEACRVKDYLYGYKEYISIDDVRNFVKTHSQDGVGRLCGLLQFKENVDKRIDSEQKVEITKRLKFDELKKVKYFVNSEYVVNANKRIYKYIHGFKTPDKNNFSMFRKFLTNQILIASSKSKNINNELSDFNLKMDDYDAREFFGVVDGMRHEAAFQDLLKEMSDVIDFRQSTNLEDSKGVDLMIRAKISNKMNDFGYYDYATPDEIVLNDFKTLELPVDIKSTKRKTEETLLKDDMSGYKLDRWVIWSHIYRDDFKLYMDDRNRTRLHNDENKEVLLLSKDIQIAAMKQLEGIDYRRKNGDIFTPELLEDRLKDIKDEILQGINRIYVDENRKTDTLI